LGVAALRGGEANLRAGERRLFGDERRLTGIGHDAAGEGILRAGVGEELRSFEPDGRGVFGTAAEAFIGEEGEEFVLDDGAAEAAAVLIEAVEIAANGRGVAGAVPALEGVETGAMPFEETAAVKLIGAGAGDDLDLRAGVSAILGGVVVGGDFDFLYGLFVGRDDGGAAPGDGVDADAVDLDIVGVLACPVGDDLRAVFDEEDGIGGAGGGAVDAGHGGGAAAGGDGAVAEDAGGESGELEGVAGEGGEVFDFSRGDDAGDGGALRVEERGGGFGDGDGVSDGADGEFDVERVCLLGADDDVFEDLL
jgi:hypothetical protein